jgi:hypothetical protein
MYYHVVTSGAVNLAQNKIRKVRVTVNAALTGTLILSDEIATAGTPLIATITNPGVGNSFEYWDLKNGLTANASTTCDITINIDSSYGPK